MPTTLPGGTWQMIAVDICEHNKSNYLVMVDYYSRYFEVLYLPDIRSKTVINKMKSVFSKYGIPYECRTDGGKQFVCKEFAEFSSNYDFIHSVSSPYFSQSNGEAEAAVKIAKRCLKQEDPFIALMLYRSTPHSATGVTPAQLMFGRQIRTIVPSVASNLKPKWPNDSVVRANDTKYKESMAFNYNRKHGCKEHEEFQPGQSARMKTDNESDWKSVTICSKSNFPRSYIVKTNDGSLYRRNAKHLLPSKTPPMSQQSTMTSLPIESPSVRDYLDRKIGLNVKNTVSRLNDDNRTVSQNAKNFGR